MNGWRWIRTTEAICSRFTVCPLWPLGNPSKLYMEIKDQPAGWGSWGDYNLMSTDNNYFTEKAKTINNLR